MKKIWIVLFFIILLAAFLRFFLLGSVPLSPDWDEAALGYNAYSVLHTGRDEFGKFLPVVLRSFDDYKPALYMYLIIPLIPFFDLTVFTVRFPSAFFGVVGVLAVSFLVEELFKNYRHKNILALASSFLLAISPWDIQFSRVGFESHIGDVFNVLVILFFLKGLKRPWLLTVSAIFAVLNIYLYQSEKIYTPLLVLGLLIINLKSIIKLPKIPLTFSFVLGTLLVLPMVFFIATNKASLIRLTGTSIFASQTDILKDDIVKLEIDNSTGDKIGQILDNRRVVFAKVIISGYLSHYNFNWLFISGDISRHHPPNMGILYLWEFPFILLGIYFLLFSQINRKTKFLIFFWFLLVPVPASITSGVPHAVRTMNFIPLYEIFTALGVVTTFFYIKNKFEKRKIVIYLISLLFLSVASFNFVYYLNQYFVQQNYFNAADWQYGWEQAASYIKSVEGNYKKIIVTDKEPLDKGYMFLAFYLKFPPKEYQKIGALESGGFAEHHVFDKFDFRPINWKKDSQYRNTLFVGSPSEFSNSPPLKIINYPNGKPAIYILNR